MREFLEIAFKHAGFDIEWSGKEVNENGIDKSSGKILVKIDPQFYRPAEVDFLVGDYTKAKNLLNWSPKTTFEDLINIMLEHDLKSAEEGGRRTLSF